MEWKQFTGFGVQLSYPPTTPRGQPAQLDEQTDRVHIHAPDRQELYVEVARFRELTPQDEYARHKPYLQQRFGAGAVTDLSETRLHDRTAWTYAFGWDEEDRRMERAALLLQRGNDTYRVIYDPRSVLNDQVLETLTFAD